MISKSWRWALGSLAIASAIASPWPATADPVASPAAGEAPRVEDVPVLRMFQDYCVAGRARAAPAMEAAQRDGFVLAPMMMVRPMIAESHMNHADARARLVDRGMLLVATGDMTDRGEAFDLCLVGVIPGVAGSLAGTLGEWIGIAAQPAEHAGEVVYVFVRSADGRRQSTDELTGSQVRRATAEGRLFVIVLVENAEGSVLIYGAVHPGGI